MGSRFLEILCGLGNLFPTLRVSVPLEERVKGLSVHAGLSRGGTDVAIATGQQTLGVGELETRQVLFPRRLERWQATLPDGPKNWRGSTPAATNGRRAFAERNAPF
jgi:hypothetical protein